MIHAMLSAGLIDTAALWKVVAASLVGGVGVVVAFGVLLVGLSKANAVHGRPARRAGYYVVSALCGLFCVAAIAVGIYAMVQKPSSPTPKSVKPAAQLVRFRPMA